MEVHGVSEKNLLKLVMKKRCAHTDKNLKLLIRIHMPSAGHNVEIVSSSRKDAKSGGELARAFCQSEGGPGNAAIMFNFKAARAACVLLPVHDTP